MIVQIHFSSKVKRLVLSKLGGIKSMAMQLLLICITLITGIVTTRKTVSHDGKERMLWDHTNLDSNTTETCDVGEVTEPPENLFSSLVV